MGTLVRIWLIAATTVLASAAARMSRQRWRSTTSRSARRWSAGGLRPLAADRDQRFNGKVGDAVARCRGGDKPEAFRKTPYVDWANYWAAGDATVFFPAPRRSAAICCRTAAESTARCSTSSTSAWS